VFGVRYGANRKGLLARGVILLHDNFLLHTARLTLGTVDQLVLEVLPHPPYGADLAPNDYCLFGPMRKMLGGQKSASDTEVQSAVCQWLRQQAQHCFFFTSGIQKLVDRWDNYVNLK